MICARRVCLPTFSVSIKKTWFPFRVPEVTLSPVDFSVGMGSPVIMLSSIVVFPSMILPSTGIFSPGFTRSISPILISDTGMLFSVESFIKCASEGTKFMSSLMAFPVFWCAFASSI